MRFSEIDLQCEDIMWFAVDANDNIIAFTSGGNGNVPEFVCHSREETEFLENYFMSSIAETTPGHLLIECGGGALSEDSLTLARKGLYSFDVSFEVGHENEYAKIAYPEIPLQLQQLPPELQSILMNHRIDSKASCDYFISVVHAY